MPGVYLKLAPHNFLSITIEANETVKAVKEKVKMAAGLSDGDRFDLSIEDEKLDEAATMGEYPLMDGDEIEVRLSNKQKAVDWLTQVGWGAKTPQDVLKAVDEVYHHSQEQARVKDKNLNEILTAMDDAGLCHNRRLLGRIFFNTACHGLTGLLSCMLERNLVDVNDRFANNLTALHFAANRGRVDAVRLLLHYNAERDFITTRGMTAAEYARNAGHWDVVDLLENRVA
eukprot:TRINITY_DN2296_c0_g1_i2.p1 TRINITY_DN2296_c0_g1~~TRINITY_DN2296_c0_g1_i2.p1  ORF type:complete len:229 (+),score=60.55 TRINITY_DN2296_c0_g1_i2:49-735(+)